MEENQKQTSSLITLAQAARLTPYSADYLNLLVRRKKLPAKKIGRNWYTSEEAVRWYMRRRHVPASLAHPALDPLHPAKGASGYAHSGQKVAGSSNPIMIGYTSKHHVVTATTALRWILLLLAILLLLILLFPEFVFGMSSTNYRIDESFIGSGGIRETSTNYQMLETLGDIGTGDSQSSNFRLRAGYLSNTQDSTLTFTVSTSSLNLGLITPSAVSSASHTMTVTTDLTRGYVITAQADGPFRSGPNTIPFVADGTVTAGSAEYGARFTGGLGSHPAGDISLASLITVTLYTDNVSDGDTTTATYRVSAAPATQPGTYNSKTTYVALATF